MTRQVYPYLLDPEKYWDYGRRYVKVPTWKTFGNRTQFVALRVFSRKDKKLVHYRRDLDLYTKEFKLGNVIWPFFETLFAGNFKELVDEIKKRGLYLFDFWGHVPGSNPEKTWGHVVPPEGTIEYMEKVLGDHFLGIDNGEQDGRYIALYASQMCPAYQNRKKEYLNFHRHFERLCNDLGNKMSALVSLTYGHYFLKEGNTMLIGAETAQGLINSQAYYAFLRGAGKQYGVLWFGNASVWNRKGYKTYETEQTLTVGPGAGYKCGPEEGTSLMLLKRLLYTHYLYNNVIVGFEQSWIVGDNTEKRIEHLPVPMESDPSTRMLSPVGEIQAAAVRFVERHGSPGVMYAPVCLMLDFYSGWTVPRHLYTDKLYQVWGNIPYSAGDYLTHGVFSLLYPGYEDSSYYPDERGYLSPTPYGDMAEVMLTDAEESVLSIYATIIVSGEIEASEEFRVKLEHFVEKGGRLIITAGNLVKFPEGVCGLKVIDETVSFPTGTEIRFGERKSKEKQAFRLYKTCDKPKEVLAHCNGIPAVVKQPFGAGEIFLCLSPFGVGDNTTEEGKNITINGATLEAPLPNPYPLLTHFEHLLDKVLNKEKLFDVGKDLGYITCRKKTGSYTIGIYNNTLKEKPFRIKSFAGEITLIKELPVDCSEKNKRGYWPTGYQGTDTGKNTKDTIAGGDIRIFKVKTNEENVKEIATLKRQKPITKRCLGLRGINSIKEEILYRPTFFRHFNGVKVGWDYLRDKDKGAVEVETRWLKLQKVAVIVDFSEGLNFYPDLTLIDNVDWRYQDSLKEILDVFGKMAIVGAKDAVFSLHRQPETHFNEEQTSASFLKNVKAICQKAAERNITIHLQNHPNKWHAKTEEIISFISGVGADNLKFCLNFGHLVMNQENIGAVLAKTNSICSIILASIPENDFLDQKYDAHLPLSGNEFEKLVRKFLPLAKEKVLVLDAEYASFDAEFKDIEMVETLF